MLALDSHSAALDGTVGVVEKRILGFMWCVLCSGCKHQAYAVEHLVVFVSLSVSLCPCSIWVNSRIETLRE